ncbi:Crp/Fnr family transcriptional regulator [Sphingobacterium paucimobilis]|uniref:Cyclic nucleotide-binding domain-containing protein n=1 Tax=Sphingobacterium paucimobilis HER1398 TaxID=1346330 RepID=U2IZ11_9SPHI|nr:Crp/Fnr family transcriptional regulator [Sphingobacterium paucimobilis]ERJ57939.1 hypothetical protein M472_04085 [Sphingobacterium paucimobilis HER1398]
MEKFRSQVVKLLQCEASSNALLSMTKVQHFDKNKIYCRDRDRCQQWCYVLDGLVGALYYYENHPPYMHWMTLPGQSFTGTKHEYSDSSHDLDIYILKDTRLAVIHLAELRRLMEIHAPIMRLINILRQRRSTIGDLKLRVMSHPPTERYRETLKHLPAIPATLNNKQLAQYLNIDPKTLYRSRRQELGR